MSSGGKDLVLGVGLDNSPAMTEARKLREGLKQINQQLLSDAQVAQEAERRLIEETNEERIAGAARAARQEAQIERIQIDDWKSMRFQMVRDEREARAELTRSVRQGTDEMRANLDDVGKSGKSSFAAIVGAGAAAVGTMMRFVGYARELRAEMDKVAERGLEMTRGLSGSRNKNRELMTLEGETDDQAFALRIRRFARDSRMTEDEARAYRLGARETGGVGRDTLGVSTYDAVLAHGAQATPTLGLDPTIAGRMLGNMMTMSPQLARLPERERVARLNTSFDQVIGRLQQSPGNLAELTRQYQEASASSLQRDNPLFGQFRTPQELASVVGVTGYLNPSTGAQQIEASIRGFMDEKAQPLLKKAGVTSGMSFMEKIRRIAPVLMKEAQDQHKPVEEVAAAYFEDIRTRRAILNQIQNGVLGGGYASIERGGEANAAALPGRVSAFQASATGRERFSAADTAVAEGERGMRGTQAEIMRQQATADMIRHGEVDSSSAAFQNFLTGAGAFGMLPNAEQWRINERAATLIEARSGGRVKRRRSWDQTFSVQSQNEEINRMTQEAQRLGIDISNPEGAAPSPAARATETGPSTTTWGWGGPRMNVAPVSPSDLGFDVISNWLDRHMPFGREERSYEGKPKRRPGAAPAAAAPPADAPTIPGLADMDTSGSAANNFLREIARNTAPSPAAPVPLVAAPTVARR